MVAFRVERREDLSAAMVIVSILVPVRVAARNLKQMVEEKKIVDPDDRSAFTAEKLVWLRPKITPLFEVAINRIKTIDVVIAAHLTFFIYQYSDMESKLERVAAAIEEFQTGEEPARDKKYLMADAQSATRNFFESAVHAECAEHLLNKFVLGRTPFFSRMWCKFFPDAKTRECREMLEKNGT